MQDRDPDRSLHQEIIIDCRRNHEVKLQFAFGNWFKKGSVSLHKLLSNLYFSPGYVICWNSIVQQSNSSSDPSSDLFVIWSLARIALKPTGFFSRSIAGGIDGHIIRSTLYGMDQSSNAPCYCCVILWWLNTNNSGSKNHTETLNSAYERWEYWVHWELITSSFSKHTEKR